MPYNIPNEPMFQHASRRATRAHDDLMDIKPAASIYVLAPNKHGKRTVMMHLGTYIAQGILLFALAVVMAWAFVSAMGTERSVSEDVRAERCAQVIQQHETTGQPLPEWAKTSYCNTGN